MHVFGFELKSLRLFAVVWTLSIAALGGVYVSVFPAFQKDGSALVAVFSKFPEAIRKGIGLDPSMMFSFLGFLSSILHFIILGVAIMAAVLGFTIFSREHRTKTSDFLMTKPISRFSVWAQKWLAGFVVVLVSSAAVGGLIGLFGAIAGAGNIDPRKYILLMAALWLVGLWFYSVSACLATLFRTRRNLVSLGMGLSMGFFLVGIVGALVDEKTVRFVSPFKTLDLQNIVATGELQEKYLAYLLAWILLATLVSAVLVSTRDIESED